MKINDILGKDSFWIVNKKLAKSVGLEAALLLSDLISKQSYFENKQDLTEDGYFFNTAEEIEKDTTLSYHKQKKALKVLSSEDYNFVETKLKGIPAKLHFKVVENKILNFFNTGVRKIKKQELENFENINNNKGNKINNNNYIADFFDFFWNTYNKKVGKKKVEAKIKRLSKKDIEAIKIHLPKYIKATPDKQFRKNPITYLNNECWNDEDLPTIKQPNNHSNSVSQQQNIKLPAMNLPKNSHKASESTLKSNILDNMIDNIGL